MRYDGGVRSDSVSSCAHTGSNRHRSSIRCALLTSLLALASCGETDEPLTCSYVNSTDYCWQAAMEVLESCMAPSGGRDYLVEGTLDDEAVRCEDDEGHSVTFHEPVELDSGAGLVSLAQYTLANGDTICGSISGGGTAESPLELTTALGLLRYMQGSSYVRLECPDGSTYTSTETGLPCWQSLPGHRGLQRSGGVIRAYLVRGPRAYRCTQARPD
jgi:hypothetical protein